MSGFKEGELIISSKPYAYVLNDEKRGQFCDYCFLRKNKLKKCSQCGFLYYCDKNCQKKAWKLHKTECKFLKPVLPSSMIRLFILVLMKIRQYGYEEPFEEFGNRRASMASLMSHAEDMKKNYWNDMMHIKISVEMCIGSDNVPPFDEFAEIYGKIFTNSFSINHLIGGPSGVGLYLGPSFFDHSCDADAGGAYDGTTMSIRMMRSVQHRDISQVRISYFNKISLREERMEYLLKSKFFVCSCSLCTSPKSDELLTKLVSDAPEIKVKANKCRKDVEDLLSKCPILDKEPELLYNKCKELLELQRGVLADTNIYRIRVLEKAFEASNRLQNYAEVVKVALQLEKQLRMFYNANDPSLGYFFFNYGMSLFYLERYAEAQCILSEAVTKLKVTYGEYHPAVLTICSYIVDCLNLK